MPVGARVEVGTHRRALRCGMVVRDEQAEATVTPRESATDAGSTGLAGR